MSSIAITIATVLTSITYLQLNNEMYVCKKNFAEIILSLKALEQVCRAAGPRLQGL